MMVKAKKKEVKRTKTLKTITVKNAEGDPDTTAEIIIQNKIDYTPKVSVIIPVYNVEPYLRECLDSVINQTLREIEIICVDDGSTDASLDILKEYAAKDNRITLFAPGHLGTGHCRNIALSVARGEYIGFIDPDDWIEAEYFEKLYTSASEDTDVVFQTSRIETYWKEGKEIVIDTPTSQNDYVFRFNTIHYSAHLWSKIFKRSFVEKYNLKNSFTKRSQDLLFTFPALLLAKNIKCINHAKYFYRKGQKSACTVEYTAQDANEVFALYTQIENKIEQFDENMLSLVKYKKNITLKRMYTTSSDDVQKIIRENAKDLYETDFDLYENNDSKMIAIKNPSPDSVDKLWWGDYWFGLDLAQGLKDQGFNVRTDYAEDFERLGKQDINLVIRGPKMFKSFDNKKLNIMYLMSRSRDIYNDELDMYDIIICASMKHTKRLQHRGYNNVYFLPQFTNPKRFYYEENENFQNDVLFVGNAYSNVFRPAVKYAVESGIPISIYGKFWENIVDNSLIKGLYIDNNDLHKYYSNAKIVLNDTNEDMRKNGFVSNRIHDATACKAFVISDYMPEIKALYGDSVPMFRDREELEKLVKYYLEHPRERRKKALKAYKITKRLCTNQKFAESVNKIIRKSKKIQHNTIKFYERIIQNWYFSVKKDSLHLEYPQTYNEKLQWLKLYDSTPIKTRLADKYLVRDWVKEKIGEEYLIPIWGVYDNFDEIDFDKLPDQFVMKCNHGSGWNIIVTDKSQLNMAEAKAKMDKWMDTNFAFAWGYEMHYRNIAPKIIIEKFINPEESDHEIQAWCFNGKIKFISVESIKDTENLVRGTFYPNGAPTEFEISPQHYHKLNVINDKEAFEKAITLAQDLLIDVPYVRIDFIEWKGSVRFREMTFTSGSGLSVIKPNAYNKKLGDMIKLPKLAYNIDSEEYYKLPKPSILKTYLLFPYYWYKLHMMERSYLNKVISKIKSQLSNLRIDVKNSGTENNAVEITSEGNNIITPKWFTNAQGKGSIIQGNQLKNTIKIKVIQDGILKLIFKSIDKKVDGKKLPLWIDYKSIKVDGKEVLSASVATWHDKPYFYEMPVKDGQKIILEVEQQYHQYGKEELEEFLLKINSEMEYVENNIDNILSNLNKDIHIINDNKAEVSASSFQNEKDKQDYAQLCLDKLSEFRIDIKNVGSENNAVEVTSEGNNVIQPKWFTNAQGIGSIVHGNQLKSIIKLKVIQDGILKFIFKGVDGKKLPLWIDYKSIKIDGKEILSAPVATRYDKPYFHEIPVKDGQEISLEVEQQYHQYRENEIKNLLFNLNSNNQQVLSKLNDIIVEIQKQVPIIDEKSYKKRKLNHFVAATLKELTSYRLDIKNYGNENNDVEISVINGNVLEQKWFTDSKGVGKIVQDSTMCNTIKLRIVNDGILKIDFKGMEKRIGRERLRIWIDYKSIKIDGNEILSAPLATWHDKPYRYEMPVKNGQEITLEVEQQYHQYTKDKLKDIIIRLNADDDHIKENVEEILTLISAYIPRADQYTDEDCRDAFVDAMNRLANQWRMTNSKFADPVGYQPTTVSCGKDMAKLFLMASSYDTLAPIWRSIDDITIKSKGDMDTAHISHSSVFSQDHHANALTDYYKLLGGKTGTAVDPTTGEMLSLLGGIIKGPNDSFLSCWVRVRGADTATINRFTAMKILVDIAYAKIANSSADISVLEKELSTTQHVIAAQVLLIPKSGKISNYEKFDFYSSDSIYNIYGYRNELVDVIGSNTKLMTVVTALSYISNFDTLVTIQPSDITGYGSVCNPPITAGEKFTIRELFYLMMMPSDCYAAMAVSRYVGSLLIKKIEMEDKVA